MTKTRKLPVTVGMRVRAYEVLSRAIEEGVACSWRRAHKHTDTPGENAGPGADCPGGARQGLRVLRLRRRGAVVSAVELYCNAERRVVGTVTGEPGSAIRAATVRRAFRAPAAKYAGLAERSVDGVALLCPRCCGPLLFRQPVTADEPTRGLCAVPGAVRFARHLWR